jgi:hypothetical protein
MPAGQHREQDGPDDEAGGADAVGDQLATFTDPSGEPLLARTEQAFGIGSVIRVEPHRLSGSATPGALPDRSAAPTVRVDVDVVDLRRPARSLEADREVRGSPAQRGRNRGAGREPRRRRP